MSVNEQLLGQVESYIENLFGLSDPALEECLRDALAAGLPAIQISPSHGKLLHLIAKIAGARRILEIGTLGGYSAIWMARALPPDGKLVTIELSPAHAAVARKNLQRAGLEHVVEVRIGDAVEVLSAMTSEAPFDLVFIDADKPGYVKYLGLAMKLSRPGTVILDQDFREIAATPEAEEWMSRIRSTSDGKFTPTAVLAVAARVRSLRGARPLPGAEPRVRVRGPSGAWVTIVAAPLIGESALSGAIAVTLAGSGAEAGTLLLEAHGLTTRERELAALVLEGFSNREIAERLFLSPYTVGDHLKAILETVGAHSKRELIAGALGGVVGEGFRTASFPPTEGRT